MNDADKHIAELTAAAAELESLTAERDALKARVKELESQVIAMNETTSAEMVTLKARVAELEKDKQRLDWLERFQPKWAIGLSPNGEWQVFGRTAEGAIQFCASGTSVRDTIDVAMNKDK